MLLNRERTQTVRPGIVSAFDIVVVGTVELFARVRKRRKNITVFVYARTTRKQQLSKIIKEMCTNSKKYSSPLRTERDMIYVRIIYHVSPYMSCRYPNDHDYLYFTHITRRIIFILNVIMVSYANALVHECVFDILYSTFFFPFPTNHSQHRYIYLHLQKSNG
jgi:hypothetical protein